VIKKVVPRNTGNIALFRSGQATYWIGVGFVFLCVFLAYLDTFASMVSIWWRSETYAHGFLIIPISLFLVWRRRYVFYQYPPRPAGLAWFLLFVAVLLWLMAKLADVLVIEHLAAVSLIPLIFWAMQGTQLITKIAFPLLYMVLAVPMGESLVPILQDITAAITVFVLQLSGIPVYLEGRYLQIPSGNFEVAEACSGIRYLIASFALSVLYAYINYRSLVRRLIFVGLSIVVPIVANGVRAYGIVMLAHLSSYQLAVGVDHIIYGWLFFGFVMFLLFWVGSFFRESQELIAKHETASVANNSNNDQKLSGAWAVCLILLVVSGPFAFALMNRPSDNVEPVPKNLKLPDGVQNWAGPLTANDNWQPYFHGAAQELRGRYQSGMSAVQVYVAYYAAQSQGRELINSKNILYDRKDWHRVNNEIMEIMLPDKRRWSVQTTVIDSTWDTRRVLWHWYEIGGVPTSSQFVAKLIEAWAKISGKNSDAAVFVLAADYSVDPTEAHQLLNKFLVQTLGKLPRSVALADNQLM